MVISSSLHGCRCGTGCCPLGPSHRSQSPSRGSASRDPFSHATPLGSGFAMHTHAHLGDTMVQCEPRSPACSCTCSSACLLIHSCVPSSWTATTLGHRFLRQAPSKHHAPTIERSYTIPNTHLQVDGSQAEKTERDSQGRGRHRGRQP